MLSSNTPGHLAALILRQEVPRGHLVLCGGGWYALPQQSPLQDLRRQVDAHGPRDLKGQAAPSCGCGRLEGPGASQPLRETLRASQPPPKGHRRRDRSDIGALEAANLAALCAPLRSRPCHRRQRHPGGASGRLRARASSPMGVPCRAAGNQRNPKAPVSRDIGAHTLWRTASAFLRAPGSAGI